jgi:ankyrin repeat protein
MGFLKKLFGTDARKEEFLKAVNWRDIEKINDCIDKGADINVRDELGDTSLIGASIENCIDIVELLLKRGANPDLKGRAGFTALIAACVVGHYNIVKKLLEGGANINITEERGLTALDFAEDRGYVEIANLLKKFGAKRTDDTSPCCWTCVHASLTAAPENKLLCTLDFRNVKAVSRDHLCLVYKKRAK